MTDKTAAPPVASMKGWHVGYDGVIRFVLRDRDEIRAWYKWLEAQAATNFDQRMEGVGDQNGR